MQLLTNLSFLLTKPTGTTTYALNLLPHLQKLEPILLTSQSFPNYNCYQTPGETHLINKGDSISIMTKIFALTTTY